MRSSQQSRSRLRYLAQRIEDLRTETIDAGREAGDVLGSEEETIISQALASNAKALLDEALIEHYELAQELLAADVCPKHGAHALVVSCQACIRAWADPRPRPRQALG